MPYVGNWDDLLDAASAPNVIDVKPGTDGVYVTFKVHGPEGRRTYFYKAPGVEELEEAIEAIEF